MITLAERITRENGGEWFGDHGRIADPARGAGDRSVVITDRPGGGIYVSMPVGCDSLQMRRNLVNAKRRSDRAQNNLAAQKRRASNRRRRRAKRAAAAQLIGGAL